MALLVGGAITAVVSSSAKSELCDMIGNQESFVRASGDDSDKLVKIETVAKRIRTLAGRLVFSGEFKDAGVGFADSLETMVTLRRAGFEDTDEVSASTAARMDEVALSGVENLSQMQRSCGLLATGELGGAASATAEMADKSAQSDVRGAIGAVERYYSETGNYPITSMSEYNNGGSTPQVALGTSSQKITLSDKTELYYVPISGIGPYKICATNTGGSGKWYLYDSAKGGSVDAVSKPATPTSCA
ncbi:hypothetical protein ADL15_37020 [Actinoplanes awajinensis subsp. mycoplanecinus]|uniref:Uncharacterized protein n=1 Tax=Actinoplanes awajinensis subsp. mycoplanecinus TaxID=135947 RepID=A0A124G8U0_9ACTN|nr:hypothetical protein ADL15_37020 [Actinoplanes awajinensis subsp. mycoplanecinus]